MLNLFYYIFYKFDQRLFILLNKYDNLFLIVKLIWFYNLQALIKIFFFTNLLFF